ncbi:hypothetical protein SPBR_05894 [Sporothrix brasiliensis 5110]|uniref:Uncharacterized protein n=1 Tax=Sporothrix brasiliensis 5110 TaxID=1398154 RepID=A0A0C2JCJ3_9PEZI|nr:uncharacterized protein SPBR_05894 [Sporothrix brasiliensis 5110]KIH94627.1 hypothetical protein SPBR_05894 [Sporothrix brasiliensis 5110]
MQGFYGLSLVDYNQYPHRLVEDERQLAALYWTCVQLEFEINAETGQAPSELHRYQAVVPTPDSDVLRFPRDNGDDTMMAGMEAVVDVEAESETESEPAAIGGFNMQTALRGHLNCIYGEAHGDNGLPTQEQKRKIDMAVANLRRQFDAVLSGRATLPHTEASVRTARACSAYWEARSYGVLFSLLKPQQQVDMEEMAEVVCSITETIRAYHGLESDRLILPNAFGTAMLQCRYLLLLFAASRALPALAAFVDDVSLRELIDHTLLSFQELLMFRDILEAARQVLKTIRARLQPHGGSGTAMQPGPGTMPELSLYCPPFRTVPGIASSIPTASTMDSFISFPTPNSPHLFPSSAFTSPQHSPSISATSSSPSPRSATFVPGSLPFRPETLAILAPASGPGPISPGAVYPRPPNAAPPVNALPIQAERVPANAADFDGFAYHLGLSLFGRR